MLGYIIINKIDYMEIYLPLGCESRKVGQEQGQ